MPLKRTLLTLTVLAGLGAAPSAALAATTHGTVTGKISYLSDSTVAIQTSGRSGGVINAMVATANALSVKVYPYVYGGGHAQAGIASVGIPGPGYNGRRVGFDCSGSVAAVLAGAGLWQPRSGVPSDAGVIAQLRSEHLIASGPGTAPNEVTLYDDWGVHIFMQINGRFFGTSDGGGGNAKGGPTWLDDGAPDASSRAYKAYHFLPSVLRNSARYGHVFAFQVNPSSSLISGAELGDKVTVGYREANTGAMTATAITYAGMTTTSGTVAALTADGLTLTTSAGQSLQLVTTDGSDLLNDVAVGDGVQVSYAKDAAGNLVLHAVSITSQAASPSDGGNSGPGSGTGGQGPGGPSGGYGH